MLTLFPLALRLSFQQAMPFVHYSININRFSLPFTGSSIQPPEAASDLELTFLISSEVYTVALMKFPQIIVDVLLKMDAAV